MAPNRSNQPKQRKQQQYTKADHTLNIEAPPFHPQKSDSHQNQKMNPYSNTFVPSFPYNQPYSNGGGQPNIYNDPQQHWNNNNRY